ncbi:hypothetical protein J6590_101711 [Homalodisca vitripennis]|nr:hypothetical protein J6590_101711 [Homalodisca vitripennis]
MRETKSLQPTKDHVDITLPKIRYVPSARTCRTLVQGERNIQSRVMSVFYKKNVHSMRNFRGSN